jgi:hypothetical protein
MRQRWGNDRASGVQVMRMEEGLDMDFAKV